MKLSPAEILRREYGTSRNLMTPRRVRVGSLPGGAYEISRGEGIPRDSFSSRGPTIFGVSIVWLNPDGTTRRDTTRAGAFGGLELAKAHVRRVRAEVQAAKRRA